VTRVVRSSRRPRGARERSVVHHRDDRSRCHAAGRPTTKSANRQSTVCSYRERIEDVPPSPDCA
jgi:hypothetical protein